MAVRLAAIGFQHQHIFHMLDHLLAEPGVELVALAEHDPALRERAAARYPVPAYDDYQRLLERERPSAAVLAPINRDRPRLIADCAQAGVHVYVDKPMATSLEGVELIAAALRGRGTIVYMAAGGGYGQSWGWRRLVDSGELGQLVQFVNLAPHRLQLRPEAGWTRPAWHFQRETNGGAIVDLAIHGINTWRYLCDQPVVEVAARHGNRRFPEHRSFEDYASVVLTMADGSTAFLGPSWLTPDAEPSHGRGATYLIGTQGQLEVTSTGVAHGLTGSRDAYQVTLTTAARPPHRPELEADELTPERDFVRAVESGRPMRIASEFVLESQRVALMARDAADQRRAIRLA
jgi:predicted dehydrogenase